MENNKNRLIRYSGSKYDYLNSILPIVNRCDNKIYIEPFCGSASVFLNTPNTFQKYIISDVDRNIIRIFNSFKNINYSDFINFLNEIEKEFGNIKNDKTSYYNFRNWFNSTHWKKDTLEEGVYLMFLANSCINSMLRFGPNGMNQSFGNRGYQYSYTLEQHTNIKNKLSNCEIMNVDFFKLIEDFKNLDAFYFIDPPYIKRGTSYVNINENNKTLMLNFLKDKKYAYTDIYEKNIQDYLECEVDILRLKMRNTSPLSNKEEISNTEVIYYN